MPLDWSIVSREHVEEACRLFDAGMALPIRPAKSTFLVVNSKRYPAKFIRGIAYRVATGIEANPDQYSGGDETVRFFKRLGMTAEHGVRTPKDKDVLAVVHPPPLLPSDPAKLKQKAAFRPLLETRFGSVITEAKFDWLIVPSEAEMDEHVARIYSALSSMRGHRGFASSGRALACDYYVPSHRLIVEYDERQHFTLARALALRQYPEGLKVFFDRSDWIATCEKIRANDPTPPFRDEQRAIYDSLRDIYAAQNRFTLIRLKDRAFDWTSHQASERLDEVLRESGVTTDMDISEVTVSDSERQIVTKYLGTNPNKWYWEDMVRDLLSCNDRRIVEFVGDRVRKTWKSKYRLSQFTLDDVDELARFIRSESQSVSPSTEAPELEIVLPETNYTTETLERLHAEPDVEKIALVSHDYNKLDADGLWDYSATARQIIEVCDGEGCDTVLFSLYTWDARSRVNRSHETLLAGLTSVRRVILEFGHLSAHSDEPGLADLSVETWLRGRPLPVIHRQRFATSQDRAGAAGQLLREAGGRHIGSAFLMICGESNIVSLRRSDGGAIDDPCGFNRRLSELGIKVILNPVHDYMRRYEMKEKRRYFSTDRRVVVSVWNRGRGSESSQPWTAFYDGRDCTHLINEIRSPVAERPDIRVGVLATAALSQAVV